MPLNAEQRTFIESIRNAYLQEIGNDPSKLMQLRSELAYLSQMLGESETVAQSLNEGEIYCVFNPPNPQISPLPIAEVNGPGTYTIPAGYRKISFAVYSGELEIFGAIFIAGYSQPFEAKCGEVYPEITYTVISGESLVICEQ